MTPDTGYRLRTDARAHDMLRTMAGALGLAPDTIAAVRFVGSGDWPSRFGVSDLAAASIGAAAAAVQELRQRRFGSAAAVTVDRRLASLWFSTSVAPEGWALPAAWDSIAGDYATQDGWVRLHTNAPHHRAAALAVLGVDGVRADVAAAVARWNSDGLETAIVQHGGCAAAMRSMALWATHPQGRSVRGEPLLAWQSTDLGPGSMAQATPARPLQGVRVLDLTRVLAGPVATRFLAGFGAQVLRIDPPTWDEPAVVADMTLGKRCARLNLREPADRSTWAALLRDADVLVHGYRGDALERLGLGAPARRALRPGLVDVSLNAYGWTGPWIHRRGFDSLVQMSCGIADAAMLAWHRDRPTPLPVQALDHASGYLMAAAAVRGLVARLDTGRGCEVRASLARTAQLLVDAPIEDRTEGLAPASAQDWSASPETTPFGPARRLRAPVVLPQAEMRWDHGAVALGSADAAW